VKNSMDPNFKITQDILETAERYINKTMTSDEVVAFEQKLDNDPTFKTLFEDIKTLLLGIEAQALKEQLHNFHEELQPNNSETSTVKPLFSLRKFVAAAAVIIALGSFWFFNNNTNKKLYSKYFTPDPGLATMMSETTNFEFYDAMVNYKQGDYKTAISKWELLLENKPKNDTLNYFIGMAYLANKNEETAITHLNIVTQNQNTNFKSDAYYYLGLAYLKANNVELAKKNLNFSTVDDSKKILNELRK